MLVPPLSVLVTFRSTTISQVGSSVFIFRVPIIVSYVQWLHQFPELGSKLDPLGPALEPIWEFVSFQHLYNLIPNACKFQPFHICIEVRSTLLNLESVIIADLAIVTCLLIIGYHIVHFYDHWYL
ncbi:hypothetical protein Hanom_Chr02g00130141 [Helianthus anomalus]